LNHGDTAGALQAFQRAVHSQNPLAVPTAALEAAVLLSGQPDYSRAAAMCQIAMSSGDLDIAPRAAVILGIL